MEDDIFELLNVIFRLHSRFFDYFENEDIDLKGGGASAPLPPPPPPTPQFLRLCIHISQVSFRGVEAVSCIFHGIVMRYLAPRCIGSAGPKTADNVGAEMVLPC